MVFNRDQCYLIGCNKLSDVVYNVFNFNLITSVDDCR